MFLSNLFQNSRNGKLLKKQYFRSNAIWCEIEWHPKMALQDNFLPAQTELSLSTTMDITTAAIAASAK